MRAVLLAAALLVGCKATGSVYVPGAPPKLKRSETHPAVVSGNAADLRIVSAGAHRTLKVVGYRGLALPATDLLAGRMGLVARRATLTFDHGTSRYGPRNEGDLMLQVEGRGAPPAVRRIGDPNHAAQGLDRYAPASLRVLLGRGLDKLAAWNLQAKSGAVQVWVGVRDKSGAWVDGPAYLRAAMKTRSMDLMKGLTVVAKSIDKERTPAYYAAGFGDVLLAAQMLHKADRWTWIGFTRARVETGPARIASLLPAPKTTLVWREFQPGGKGHTSTHYRTTPGVVGLFVAETLVNAFVNDEQ